MRISIMFLFLAPLAGLGGCRNAENDEQARTANEGVAVEEADENVVTGTIRYLDLEGGFYGIETDDGRKLDPVNLPGDFKQDGVRVRARVERLEGAVSFRMWGTLVRILEIRRL